MRIGLFIPCYVDQFYPKVAIATLELLEKLGCEVHYPLGQTCCGQPMANAGFASLSNQCNSKFFNLFQNVDYIVSPSGSCVLHLKEHLDVKGFEKQARKLRQSIYELSEFLIDVLKIENLDAVYEERVGLHIGCHGQRGLRLSSMSELNEVPFSKTEKLLSMVKGLELFKSERADECCGFGGTFCVSEEAVSVQMGKDRISEHMKNDIKCIVGSDMSCLMHLEGILKKQNSKIEVKHIAELLNSN